MLLPVSCKGGGVGDTRASPHMTACSATWHYDLMSHDESPNGKNSRSITMCLQTPHIICLIDVLGLEGRKTLKRRPTKIFPVFPQDSPRLLPREKYRRMALPHGFFGIREDSRGFPPMVAKTEQSVYRDSQGISKLKNRSTTGILRDSAETSRGFLPMVEKKTEESLYHKDSLGF